MEDKRKKRSPKVSLPQPPPPPVNPRKLPVLPASKSASFSLGLPQPPSPKPRGKYKRSVGAMGTAKEVLTVPVLPPKATRFVREPLSPPSRDVSFSLHLNNKIFTQIALKCTYFVYSHVFSCTLLTQLVFMYAI